MDSNDNGFSEERKEELRRIQIRSERKQTLVGVLGLAVVFAAGIAIGIGRERSRMFEHEQARWATVDRLIESFAEYTNEKEGL